MKFKKRFWQKIFSIFSTIILLLNSFAPYLPALTVSAEEPLTSEIKFNQSTYSFELSANTKEKVEYLLAYKTPDNVVGIAPSTVEKSDNEFFKEILAGTMSGNDIKKDTIIRGIYKVKVESANFLNKKQFIFENNSVQIVEDATADAVELTENEAYWLEHGSYPEATVTPTTSPTIELTPTTSPTPGVWNEVQVEEEFVSAKVVKTDGSYVDPSLLPDIWTDQADYAPTEKVIVYGKNFTPDYQYTIEISSTDPPPVLHTDSITALSNGTFTYSYQLDGTYRPNYQVFVYDTQDNLVAQTSFTDSIQGAIWTTDDTCTVVDENVHYATKQDVYLNGGSQGEGNAQGLPDGNYWVKVTEPEGTVLGTSATNSLIVTGGQFSTCYRLWDHVFFYDTTNSGDEYKVWISQDPTFPNNDSKTDNFKVRSQIILPNLTVKLCKTNEQKEPLPGWDLFLTNESTKVDGPTLINVNSGSGTDSISLSAGKYLLKVSGTYQYGNTSMIADAAFSYRPIGIPDGIDGWVSGFDLTSGSNGLMAWIDGVPVHWGAFQETHIYYYLYDHTGGEINFSIYDNIYTDNINNNNFQFEIYSVDALLSGTTGDDGCFELTEVDFGDYYFTEILKDGWDEIAGEGIITVNEETETFVIVNTRLGNEPTPTSQPTATPTPAPYCGDEIVQEPEQCDGTAGVTEAENFCTPRCKLVPIYDGNHSCPTGTTKVLDQTYNISAQASNGINLNVNYGTGYLFEVSGTYSYDNRNSAKTADAVYATADSWSSTREDIGIWGTNRGVTSVLGDFGSGVGVIEWDDDYNYDNDHTYSKYFEPNTNSIQFVISDWYSDWYSSLYNNQTAMSDNTGGIDLKIYECIANTGSIQGRKYNDINGNGDFDTNEKKDINRLDNWTIRFFDSQWNELDSMVTGDDNTSAGNVEKGQYRFVNVSPGSYYICEDVKNEEGWIQTEPSINTGVKNPITNTICHSLTINPGQNITDIQFGNFKTAVAQGRKYEDINQNGTHELDTEPRLNDWEIHLYDSWKEPISVFTDGEGSNLGLYRFENLMYGHTYQVCEVIKSGWSQTGPLLEALINNATAVTNQSNNTDEGNVCWQFTVNQSGQEFKNLKFGNIQLGQIIIDKVTTPTDDPTEFEFNISGQNEFLKNFNLTDQSNPESTYVRPGFYTVSETETYGWNTRIECISDVPEFNIEDNNPPIVFNFVKPVNAQSELPPILLDPENLQIDYGETITCTFYNDYITPELTIQKYNNKWPVDQSAGTDVTFTIIVTALKNIVRNVKVIDLLPEGFTFTGSFSASSSDNPAYTLTSNPVYSSPGTWGLGDLQENEIITLTYTAKIADSQEPGLYKDLAYAYGCEPKTEINDLRVANINDVSETEQCSVDDLSAILATSEPSGKTDPGEITDQYVGTKINLVKEQQDTASREVVKEEEGEVLGASTGLPATGGNTIWVIIASIVSLLGLLLVSLGFALKKGKIKILSKFFALILITLSFLTISNSSVFALEPLTIRLEAPQSPTRINNFKLVFVTMDMLGRDITVRCYKDGSQFGSDISISSGGNTGYCQVDSSVINSKGTYSFYATATANGTTVNSETVSVDYNTNEGPGTPQIYSKEHPDACRYIIKFKTSDDGDKTVKVDIYRSENTSFNLDGSTRVGSVAIGSNTEGSFTNDISSDCNKTYYFAIRAFDVYGNGSGVIGDSEIKVTTTTTTTTTEITETADAIPVKNITLPSAEVLGEKTGTEEAKEEKEKEEIITLPGQKALKNVLGAAIKQENRWIVIGVGILALAIIGYAIYRYKKNKS